MLCTGILSVPGLGGVFVYVMAALDAIQIPTVGFYDLDQVSGFHLEAIFANGSSSTSLRPHEYPTRMEKPLMRKWILTARSPKPSDFPPIPRPVAQNFSQT
jgi:hypothetical protein